MPFKIVFLCVCDYLNLDDFDSGAVYKKRCIGGVSEPCQISRMERFAKTVNSF